MITNESSLGAIQEHFRTLYSANNHRIRLTGSGLAIRLLASACHMSKATRKGMPHKIPGELPRTVGWIMGVANLLKIDVTKELRHHFPEACPYCGCKPCDPSLHMGGRIDLAHLRKDPVADRPFFLDQRMFADIYPNNVLWDSVQHLVEEMAESAVAYSNHRVMTRPKDLPQVGLELTDALAHTCAIATLSNLNLAEEIVRMYGSGCPDCHYEQCHCTFAHVAELY